MAYEYEFNHADVIEGKNDNYGVESKHISKVDANSELCRLYVNFLFKLKSKHVLSIKDKYQIERAINETVTATKKFDTRQVVNVVNEYLKICNIDVEFKVEEDIEKYVFDDEGHQVLTNMVHRGPYFPDQEKTYRK